MLRLAAQLVADPQGTPAGLVARLGAVQAQDYLSSLWAIGLRVAGATEASIEQAVADRQIIRTWPMRGTLHFVAAADVRWMLALLTPRILAGSATRHRQLELDERVFLQSKKRITVALEGGKVVTRDALFKLLEEAGIACANQRGYHILWKHAQEGHLCCGPREGKQPTFVLLEEWVPAAKPLGREEALAELARRFFTGHGPATLADFVWWSGLKITDARAGLAAVSHELERIRIGDDEAWMSPQLTAAKTASDVFLLPGFDEFLLGYRDRSAVLDPEHAPQIVPGNNGMFLPMLVSGGRIIGTWKRTLKRKSVAVSLSPFVPMKKAEARACAPAIERYGKFLGLAVE